MTTSYQPGDIAYQDAGADDLDLLADRRFRPTWFTVVLVVLIGVALAFGGGVLVQKHYGTSGSAAASGFPGAQAGGFGPRTGGTAGVYGGFGAGAAGAPPGAAAPGTAPGTASSGNSASSAPVVVGTIAEIAGSTLTVKNFAGKNVRVTVPAGASVTLVAGSKLPVLATGSTVSVAGKANSDGSVTATAVTVRSS